MGRRTALTSMALALSLLACSPAPGIPSPRAVEVSEPTLPPEIQNAIVLRQNIGLRADEAYVRALDASPDAQARARLFALEFPVTAAEVGRLVSVQKALDVVEGAVTTYGPGTPDDWAGAWFDGPRQTVVAQFTANLDEHRAALQDLTYPDAPLEVRQVRWTLRELEERAAMVFGERQWLESVDAHLSGIGVDPSGNVVLADIDSPDPLIAQRIVDHFDAVDWMRVRVGDALPWTGGYGSLRVFVTTPDGKPATDVKCRVSSETPSVPSQESPTIDDDDGSCTFELEATTHRIEVIRKRDAGDLVLETRNVSIAPGDEATLRIVVPDR